ncbi:MAG: DUF2935 domain-containing protein [Pelosinus sp.]|nr:DUF2935 domain-containing protein [Pelosinus sp.]
MPRQIVYGVPQPIEPLNMEEIRFWLGIMQEHAMFIKQGLPCERTDLKNEAESFNKEFCQLRERAEQCSGEKKYSALVADAYNTVKDFCRFKRQLIELMLCGKLHGCNFPLLLDHMAREAEYVLRLLDKMRDGKVAISDAAKAQEAIFWLRIMADHAKFMAHLMDPSEYNLIGAANEFSEEFDTLYLQGNDFASMLQCSGQFPVFKRFIKDMRSAVMRLRDFKKASREMIAECKLVGLIPEELAAHVLREADHFLLILAMMEKGIMKNMSEPIPEYVEYEREEEEQSVFEEEPACNEEELSVIGDQSMVEDEEFSLASEAKSQTMSEFVKPAVKSEPPVMTAPKSFLQPETTKKAASKPKSKWDTKWPRPLGKK